MEVQMRVRTPGVNWTVEEAKNRITYCLDELETEGFQKGISWNTCISKCLDIEEMLGALVAAEQAINNLESLLKQEDEEWQTK